MPDLLLTRDDIVGLLTEVAERLGQAGQRRELVVVGGSYLSLVGLRCSTHDVNTLTALDRPMRDAVSAVAGAHGLPAGWLNSDARPRRRRA